MSAEYVKCALRPQFMGLPAWVILPIPYMAINPGIFSVVLFVVVMALAAFLKHKGRTLMWVVRRFKTRLRNERFQARPLGYRRRVSMDQLVSDFDFDTWRALK